jgi:transcriptional regulator with XRE-family HTH domain
MDKQQQQKTRITVEDVARVLHALRKKKGMTQKAVADELGISQSNFSKMENSLLEPSAIQWMTFCQLMGVSTELILQEKKRPKMSA